MAASFKLWFDVEKRYKTIVGSNFRASYQLWFDVEKRYKTINGSNSNKGNELWFDVEKRYKTIVRRPHSQTASCGLM